MINERERWPTTVSVVAMIDNTRSAFNHAELVMVRKRGSGLWGPIAGGIEKTDTTIIGAMRRELWEEGLLEAGDVVGLYQAYDSVLIQGESKSRIGIPFLGALAVRLGGGGRRIDNSTETDWLRAWGIGELTTFIDGERRELLYKPEFNVGMIGWWLEQTRF